MSWQILNHCKLCTIPIDYVSCSFLIRIFNKLHEEAQTGPGSGSANAKKGTVDVKRGGRYFSVQVLCIYYSFVCF